MYILSLLCSTKEFPLAPVLTHPSQRFPVYEPQRQLVRRHRTRVDGPDRFMFRHGAGQPRPGHLPGLYRYDDDYNRGYVDRRPGRCPGPDLEALRSTGPDVPA